MREAARVERVVGAAAAAGAAGFWATFLVRFLGTGSSEFSLSSPDNSSLLRFFARVVFVAFAYAGVGLVVLVLVVLIRTSGDVAGLEVALTLLVAALRVLRGAVPAAAAFFVVGAFPGGAGAATGCSGADALRRLESVV